MTQIQLIHKINMQEELEAIDFNILTCEYLDETFFTNKGVVVNFINSNCAGATNLIGGFRLSMSDIRKIPAYLAKHKNRIRAYAVRSLDRHIQNNLCSTGAGETLGSDEYGISFTVASLTEKGAQLNPSGRNEGPLYYCCMPGLLERAVIGHNEDGSMDMAYFVNAYIHLLPASTRRPQVLKKLAEDKKAVVMPQANQPRGTNFNRGSYEVGAKGIHPYAPRYYEDPRPRSRPYQEATHVQPLALVTVAPVMQPTFPPLPTTPAIVWTQGGLPEMPKDL